MWCRRNLSQCRHSTWGVNCVTCCAVCHTLPWFAVVEITASAPRISVTLSCLVSQIFSLCPRAYFLCIAITCPPNLPRPAVWTTVLCEVLLGGLVWWEDHEGLLQACFASCSACSCHPSVLQVLLLMRTEALPWSSSLWWYLITAILQSPSLKLNFISHSAVRTSDFS
jgi:hypothetical protein